MPQKVPKKRVCRDILPKQTRKSQFFSEKVPKKQINRDKLSKSAWDPESAWDPGSQDPAYYAGLGTPPTVANFWPLCGNGLFVHISAFLEYKYDSCYEG